MTNEDDETVKKGVEAIIYLQKMAGITETPEKAKKGWQSMSKSEQATTMKYYDLFSKPLEP